MTQERGPLQRCFQDTQTGRGTSYHNMVSEEQTSVSQPETPDTLDRVSDKICEKSCSCNMDIKVPALIEKVVKQHYCYHHITGLCDPTRSNEKQFVFVKRFQCRHQNKDRWCIFLSILIILIFPQVPNTTTVLSLALASLFCPIAVSTTAYLLNVRSPDGKNQGCNFMSFGRKESLLPLPRV